MSKSTRAFKILSLRYGQILSRLRGRSTPQNAVTVRGAGAGAGCDGIGWGLEPLEPRMLLSTASQLVFTSLTAADTAGVAITTVVVKIEDSGGGVVHSDSNTITLGIATGPGSLAVGSTTTIGAVSGVATFTSDLTITTAGVYTLSASDATDSLSGFLSSTASLSATVSPAAATQLVYTAEPTGTIAGATLSTVLVAIEDTYSNIETGNSHIVILSTGGTPGNFTGGSTTGPHATSGVATFTNLVLDTAGTYTLSASDTNDGLSGFTSSPPFTIIPAAPAQLMYTTQPVDTTAGVTMANFVVAVEDTFGNLVTTDASSITLSIASGPGSGTTLVSSSPTASGVVTFSGVTLTTAGAYKLMAADAIDSGITKNSAFFTITPAAPTQLVYTTEPTGTSAGATLATVLVAIEDTFGNVETSDSHVVVLSTGGSPGNFTGGSTNNLHASAGVASFTNLVLDTAGVYTLSASDANDSLIGFTSSPPFTITPAVATTLVYTTQPANTSAGATMASVAVTVEDTYGNVETGDNSTTIALAFAGAGSFTSGTTNITVTSGVASFTDLVINTAGVYTLAATDPVDSLTTPFDSNSFTITPAAPFQLIYTIEPTGTSAGATLATVVVAIEDTFGNVETGDSHFVVLSTGGSPGNFTGGSTTNLHATSGVASFTNLVLDTAGVYTLSASDAFDILSGFTSSPPFTIIPAAPAQLMYTTQPVGTTAGATLANIVVAVEDTFGNIVTTDSSSITLSIATGPGSGTTLVSSSPTASGVVTFSGVTLTTAGTYKLMAADAIDSGITKNSAFFTITAAAPYQLDTLRNVADTSAGSFLEDTSSSPISILVEDMYGNVVTNDSSTITMAIHSGPGIFASGTTSVGAISGVATFADLVIDATGNYRLNASDTSESLTGGSFNTNAFSISASAAEQLAYVNQPTNTTAGNLFAPLVTVAIEDTFGNIITSDSNTITIAFVGSGSFASGTTSIGANSGVATFTDLIINIAGVYTLGVTDSVDNFNTPLDSNSFTINPAAATQLYFSTQPVDTTAGATMANVTVTIEDTFGNIVNSNHTVELSILSGPGNFTGTSTTNVPITSGVATFTNLALDTAGVYQIHANNDQNQYSNDSSTFTVSPAAYSKLVYTTQPVGTTAGATLADIVVAVEDTFGNIVTSDSSSITLSIASGPGSGTTLASSDPTATGVVTFSGVTLTTAGTYKLMAADAIDSGITRNSTPFTITAASPYQLDTLNNVADGTAGSPLEDSSSGPITILIEDMYGNVVTTDSSTITMAIHSGPGIFASGTTSIGANSGVATFTDLVLDIAGNYKLNASDASEILASGSFNTNGFSISATTATTLVYAVQPADTTAGATMASVAVSVEDTFGNVVAIDSSTITLTFAGAGSFASGTTTILVVSGVASFTDLVIDTAGVYTLAATDSGDVSLTNTPADSNPFTITPAAPFQLIYTTEPAGTTAGATLATVLVAIEDTFGNVETTNTHMITLSTGGTPGNFTGGSNTGVHATSGVASFTNLVLHTAGVYTLSASETFDNLSGFTSSPPFTITPATATTLVYTTQPANTSAGATMASVAVTVEDTYGNVETGDNSTTIALAFAGAGSFASGTTTIAVTSGVASFTDLVINTVGVYTLAATDPIDSLTTPFDSNSFTITSAAPFQLVYTTEPTGTTAGATLATVLVAIEDTFGNIETTDNHIVVLSTGGTPDNFAGGSTTNIHANSGVATFTNLVLDTAGVYTLTASDANDTLSGFSSSPPFTITAAAPSKLMYTTEPVDTTAGATLADIVVAVEDTFGNIVTSDSSSITLSIASGPGSGTTLVSSSPTASGVVTFSGVTLTTTGVYKLMAADAIDSGINKNSTSFTITAAAPSQLVYTTEPVGTTAGATLADIVVSVEDTFGNIVTSDSSSITLSIASGPGSGTTLVSSNPTVLGVVTFSGVTLTTAGVYKLKSTDALDSGITKNSTQFTITPAVATTLVFTTQPANTPAGATMASVAVTVEDTFGNIETNDSSTVTLAFAGAGSFASGTTTIAVNSGVASFTDLVIDTTGTYTLAATDSGDVSLTNTPLDSNSFTITSAGPSQLVYTIEPTGTSAGATLATVLVAIEDTFGNVETTDNHFVVLSTGGTPDNFTGGSTTNIHANSGVATFTNLVLDTTGVYTLTAADSSDSLSGFSSSPPFTITAAAPSKLMYTTEPVGTTAGATLADIVVAVEDTFGNIVTSDSSSITLSIATGPGSGTTLVSSDPTTSGVATFSGVTLTTAGAYRLMAADALDSGINKNSSQFTITPAAPFQLVYTTEPTGTTAGATLATVLVAIEDTFGNVETTDNHIVVLSTGGTPDNFTGASTTNLHATSGVATFTNLVLDTAGVYTLTASDAGDTLSGFTSSPPFTITAAAPSKLMYTTQPVGNTAGATLADIVVAVEDTFGNIVTSDSSSITLSIATGPGSGTTLVSSDPTTSGVATFSGVTLTTAGVYKLMAADALDSGINKNSTSFTITAAAPSQLVYTTEPTGTSAGATLATVVVAIEDTFGNIVTTDGHAIVLTTGGTPGNFTGGSTTSVNAASGVASFSNLVLDTPGIYTLTASDSGDSLSGFTSSPTFSITAAAASQLVFTTEPANTTAGATLANVVVTIEDDLDNTVTSDSNTVTLAIATGPGGFVSSTTSVAAISGVATFTDLVITKTGVYTLGATDPGDSLNTPANSTSFTIAAAAPHQLVYTTQPVNTTAGIPMSSVVAEVKDTYGNIVTSDSSSITIAIASGPGAFAGGTTSIATTSGVASFAGLVIDTSGVYTLSVTDPCDSLNTPTPSNSFTITAAAASQLVFTTEPASTTAGATLANVVVKAEDQYNNVILTDSANVTLALGISPPSSTLLGTLTHALTSGVATFNNLALDTAGAYTLSASSGVLPLAHSNTFTITPAAPSQLVITHQPGNSTAGAPITPPVIVTIEDRYGNVETGDSAAITITIAGGTGTFTGSSTTTVNATSGVATFSNLALTTSGYYSLRAASGGVTTITTTSFSITQAAATHLAFTVQPGSTIAGRNFSPVVTVEVLNASNGVVTVNRDVITLSVHTGPSGSSLSGVYSVSANNGVASFPVLDLTEAGVYTLSASDFNNFPIAVSNIFTITPTAASKLVLSEQTARGSANNPISPALVVNVEDVYGNIITTDHSLLNFSIVSSTTTGGALTGDTGVYTTSGVATFSSLSLSKDGTYTIKITDGTLTAATMTLTIVG